MVVYVLDGSVPMDDKDAERVSRLDPDRSIVVLNKIDLPEELSVIALRKKYPHLRVLEMSATTGRGIADLEEEMIDLVGRETLGWIARERIVLNARLIALLEAADEQLAVLMEHLPAGTPLEILAVEVRELLGFYEEATGKKYSENLLDHIFSRFCIGK